MTHAKTRISKPLISVLMPYFNAGTHLAASIRSILDQTMADLECILVNDGSSDDSEDIARSFHDQRIIHLRNDENSGLTTSLNSALARARGTFIARMDADDISLPTRFASQVEYMLGSPEVPICGTGYTFENGQELQKTILLPEQDNDIRARMLFTNAVAHPTVMIRASFLKANKLLYNEIFTHSQDYELWMRAFPLSDTRFYNIQESLLLYRQHSGQISNSRLQQQSAFGNKVRIIHLKRLGINADEASLNTHKQLFVSLQRGESLSEACRSWKQRLLESNRRTGYIAPLALEKLLAGKRHGA